MVNIKNIKIVLIYCTHHCIDTIVKKVYKLDGKYITVCLFYHNETPD